MTFSESGIFPKLEHLCTSPGYIYALAFICFNNEIVMGSKAEPLPEGAPPYLAHTEIMTLVGLLIKAPISYHWPSIETLSGYVEESYTLLHELHEAIATKNQQTSAERLHPISRMLREAILYAGDSAYHFQYVNFATAKYGADSDWLWRNKHVDLNAGRSVCMKLAELYWRRKEDVLLALDSGATEPQSLLDIFQHSLEKIGLTDAELAFIRAFTLPHSQNNAEFTSATAFNAAHAYPIIRKNANEIIVLSHYWLTQAFYESPYFWLLEDKGYRQIAAHNRGEATESIATDLLARVFSRDNVFKNVKIYDPKGRVLGEIDVLVVYANHVIVLQAKSKRLTLPARKGYVRALEEDFGKAVRKAADQAFSCAQNVDNSSTRLSSPDGRPIPKVGPNPYIFTLTVLLDHYPALLSQTYFLLEKESAPRIAAPFATDIFALDSMAELLDSPLKFLHYLSQRTRNPNLLQACHEHELIGLYLKRGLAFKEDIGLVWVEGNLSNAVDIAMHARRNNEGGPDAPESVLDRASGTYFGNLINALEHNPDPTATNLGLVLLDAIQSSLPIEDLNRKVEACLRMVARGDDFSLLSFVTPQLSTGVTIMCVPQPNESKVYSIGQLCNIRKYGNRLPRWFGILLGPSGEFAYACEINRPWKYDPKLESILNDPRCP